MNLCPDCAEDVRQQERRGLSEASREFYLNLLDCEGHDTYWNLFFNKPFWPE